MKLDIDFVRKQFPAFQEASLKGQAFFENAGGSYTCRQVIDRLDRFYRQRKVQPYSAYEASRLGGEEMDEARSRLAALMGIETDECSFGPSTTQNTYVLAQAFGQMLNESDAIIVTNQDHEANTGAWRRLADRGIEIREWRIDPETGLLDVSDLDSLIDERVKLLCFPHCSNIVGAINDVAKISDIARAAGVYTCVDGVSYAPHGIPNVASLGCDIYLFSSYKTYGPHQGIMAIKRQLGMKLPNQGHYFNANSLYMRFTPAGPDHAQVAASAGIADYIDELYSHHFGEPASDAARGQAVHDLMRQAEIELLQPILTYLSENNSVRLIGPTEAAQKAATIAIVPQADPTELVEKLIPYGIMAGASDFYGVRCLEGLKEDPDRGVLRLSFVHYTQKQEIDQLLEALEALL